MSQSIILSAVEWTPTFSPSITPSPPNVLNTPHSVPPAIKAPNSIQLSRPDIAYPSTTTDTIRTSGASRTPEDSKPNLATSKSVFETVSSKFPPPKLNWTPSLNSPITEGLGQQQSPELGLAPISSVNQHFALPHNPGTNSINEDTQIPALGVNTEPMFNAPIGSPLRFLSQPNGRPRPAPTRANQNSRPTPNAHYDNSLYNPNPPTGIPWLLPSQGNRALRPLPQQQRPSQNSRPEHPPPNDDLELLPGPISPEFGAPNSPGVYNAPIESLGSPGFAPNEAFSVGQLSNPLSPNPVKPPETAFDQVQPQDHPDVDLLGPWHPFSLSFVHPGERGDGLAFWDTEDTNDASEYTYHLDSIDPGDGLALWDTLDDSMPRWPFDLWNIGQAKSPDQDSNLASQDDIILEQSDSPESTQAQDDRINTLDIPAPSLLSALPSCTRPTLTRTLYPSWFTPEPEAGDTDQPINQADNEAVDDFWELWANTVGDGPPLSEQNDWLEHVAGLTQNHGSTVDDWSYEEWLGSWLRRHRKLKGRLTRFLRD